MILRLLSVWVLRFSKCPCIEILDSFGSLAYGHRPDAPALIGRWGRRMEQAKPRRQVPYSTKPRGVHPGRDDSGLQRSLSRCFRKELWARSARNPCLRPYRSCATCRRSPCPPISRPLLICLRALVVSLLIGPYFIGFASAPRPLFCCSPCTVPTLFLRAPSVLPTLVVRWSVACSHRGLP